MARHLDAVSAGIAAFEILEGNRAGRVVWKEGSVFSPEVGEGAGAGGDGGEGSAAREAGRLIGQRRGGGQRVDSELDALGGGVASTLNDHGVRIGVQSGDMIEDEGAGGGCR